MTENIISIESAKTLSIEAQNIMNMENGQLWDIAVQAQYGSGISSLVIVWVWIAILSIVFFIINNSFKKALKENSFNSDLSFGYEVFRIISGLLFAVMVVVSMFETHGSVMRLMNPEWYAAREIMYMFIK
jgi:hypothetical protein